MDRENTESITYGDHFCILHFCMESVQGRFCQTGTKVMEQNVACRLGIDLYTCYRQVQQYGRDGSSVQAGTGKSHYGTALDFRYVIYGYCNYCMFYHAKYPGKDI